MAQRRSFQGVTAPSANEPTNTLEALKVSLRRFAAMRDWDQFHSPKNLAIALSVEASELLEHFQWMTEAESQRLARYKLTQVRDELADVLIYVVRMADKLEIDLLDAAVRKIKKNARKYPAEKVRASSKKYTER
jgi:dCTP diphosphatase